MNKPDKLSLFKSSVLMALLGAAFASHAAGLGKLSVYSAIGQPLNAEIALTATPEELPSVTAKLAPHGAFVEAGIEMMPVLVGLQFKLDKSSSGQPVLRLTTAAPLNEPFLHFLLELNWTSGRMVREYTFLLDPPEMLRVAKPMAVAPATPAAKPVARPEPVRVAPLSEPSAAAARGEAEEYRVKLGDTLSKIARDNKAESVSLDQMLVALFNSNREAFDGNNMNRLRAGKILRLPDAAEAAKVEAGEARQLVIGQARDFNAYRRRLAEAAGAAPPAEAAARQEVAGKIEARVESKAPPTPPSDKLEVSRTETAKAPKTAGKGSIEEELIARDKALREASERIAQLEKNIENLKKLVELKSQSGAQLQQQAEVKAPAAPPAEPKPVPAEKPAEAQAVKPAEAPKPAEPAQPAQPAPKPAAKPAAPPPPPPPEPSFIEDNPAIVYGGGGVLALLLGYLGFAAWRKRKQAREWAELNEQPSRMEAEPTAKSGTMFGATSESVDSGEVSIQGDFSEGGVLTTEESVDPVAEADVLMAYGRDSQAEEILKEGLKADPTRAAIHLKLLELYANRKDAQQFEAIAQQLHALSAGQGAEWHKAGVLAAGLGITGGLFAALGPETASQQAVEEAAPPTAAPAAVEVSEVPPVAAQIEEAAPAAEAGSLDFDLDLGTTSKAVEPEPAPAAAQPASEEAVSLDFDFDLGTPSTEAAAPAPAAPVAAEPPAEEGGIDFALDIGDMPGGAAEKVEEVAGAPAVSATDEISFDLDLGSGEAAPAPEAAQPAVEPVAPAPLGEVKLDFDLELDSVAEPTPQAAEAAEMPATDFGAISLDLEVPQPASEALAEVASEAAEAAGAAGAATDFDLDLDAGAVEPAAPASETTAAVPDLDLSFETAPAVEEAGERKDASLADLPDIDLDVAPTPSQSAQAEEVADNPEVATKLELAQAYEEMGDREGARELLNEVLNEGSPAQQAQARARLEQLDV